MEYLYIALPDGVFYAEGKDKEDSDQLMAEMLSLVLREEPDSPRMEIRSNRQLSKEKIAMLQLMMSTNKVAVIDADMLSGALQSIPIDMDKKPLMN